MEIVTYKPLRNQKNNKPRSVQYGRSRLLSWHQGQYQELILFVTASASPLANCRAYVWRVLESKGEISSGIGTAFGLSEADTEAVAVAIGWRWIRTHRPDARVRVRSSLERRMLFGEPSTKRRSAA